MPLFRCWCPEYEEKEDGCEPMERPNPQEAALDYLHYLDKETSGSPDFCVVKVQEKTTKQLYTFRADRTWELEVIDNSIEELEHPLVPEDDDEIDFTADDPTPHDTGLPSD